MEHGVRRTAWAILYTLLTHMHGLKVYRPRCAVRHAASDRRIWLWRSNDHFLERSLQGRSADHHNLSCMTKAELISWHSLHAGSWRYSYIHKSRTETPINAISVYNLDCSSNTFGSLGMPSSRPVFLPVGANVTLYSKSSFALGSSLGLKSSSKSSLTANTVSLDTHWSSRGYSWVMRGL